MGRCVGGESLPVSLIPGLSTRATARPFDRGRKLKRIKEPKNGKES